MGQKIADTSQLGYDKPTRGRIGFDVEYKTCGACRGGSEPRKNCCTIIVANNDNYALAA